MVSGRLARCLAALGVAFALSACDDGKAVKELNDKLSKLTGEVSKLGDTVKGLESRVASLESRARSDQGPTQEELASAIKEIDAAGKGAAGSFIANYQFLEAEREGNGNWKVVFGHRSGAGPRVLARVRKVATGWAWIKGDVWTAP